MKIVHLSTTHCIDDVRVVRKECRSLVELGHDVSIVLPGAPTMVGPPGLDVQLVPLPRSRPARMTLTAFQVFRRAWQLPADVYHFHSPELIPWMFLLLLRQRPIVYDVHEDFRTGIKRAIYLPYFVAVVFGFLLRCLEQVAQRCFTIVIAEKYYRSIFPRSSEVLNYPRLEDFAAIPVVPVPQCNGELVPTLLYTGSVVRLRGALRYADIAREMPEATVRTVGIAARGLVKEMRERSHHASNLEVVGGIRQWVPHSKIIAAYSDLPVLGMAIFPDSDHYREKELTKFFEYMAAGLPIVCSDFPVWKALIADNGVGICVDPEDLQGTVAAIRALIRDPARRQAMADQGRRLAAERFNWDIEAARLDGLYSRIALKSPLPQIQRSRTSL